MGKTIYESAFQKIFLFRKSLLLITLIFIITGSWVSCGGGGGDESHVTISLRVVGEEEVVFDWTTDRCDDGDISDLPARAFRDDSGQVQMIASHSTVRRNIGPDLNNLTHDCRVVMESDRDPDPAAFNDHEWMGSTYTEDGRTIYMLVNNEYHGFEYPGQCSSEEFWYKCWFIATTLAVSTDSGASYHHPVTPPEHLVAAAPKRYEPDSGVFGVSVPSNIVKGQDGYYYSIVGYGDEQELKTWQCLMRTQDLSDPKSWRFWDGSSFAGTFIDPYTEEVIDPESHECAPIDLDVAHHSLTFNEFAGRYVLIGQSSQFIDGRNVEGFFYTFSDDLIHWTSKKLLIELNIFEDPEAVQYEYASLIDPESTTRSFETTGKTAYLYYTRFNFGLGSLDRDLIRLPVEFFME